MDVTLALAGFGVGAVVGLTGMGGGALMTPVLVLFFGIPPLAAVSSDLVVSAVMKPFGGVVHARRGTVNWRLVGWLCAGSVPSAFCGALLAKAAGGENIQNVVKMALGVALLLAVAGLIGKAWAATRRRDQNEPLRIRPIPTLVLGVLGGLVVGLTSVGSGSLIIVILLMLYPMLRANDLVGTDLVQAVPLVTAAALGHLFFGDLHLDVAAALLVGSIPGVLLGAHLSARAPAAFVRAALSVVLLASGLKLLGLPDPVLVVAAVAATAVVTAMAMTRQTRQTRAQERPLTAATTRDRSESGRGA